MKQGTTSQERMSDDQRDRIDRAYAELYEDKLRKEHHIKKCPDCSATLYVHRDGEDHHLEFMEHAK